MKHLYESKEVKYFSTIRKDLIKLLPTNPRQKVLEVGAAKGDSLVYIKDNKLAEEVIGIDLFKMPDTNQTNPAIDAFYIADIEKDDLGYLQLNYFDVIICGDVLEHLLDPWATVERLSHFLTTGGIFIASIPNIRNIRALKKIFLSGSFEYTSSGLFDKTHFRFFCKKNASALLSTHNLKVEGCISNLVNNKAFSPARLVNSLTFRLFEEFLSLQYLVVSKKF